MLGIHCALDAERGGAGLNGGSMLLRNDKDVSLKLWTAVREASVLNMDVSHWEEGAYTTGPDANSVKVPRACCAFYTNRVDHLPS